MNLPAPGEAQNAALATAKPRWRVSTNLWFREFCRSQDAYDWSLRDHLAHCLPQPTVALFCGEEYDAFRPLGLPHTLPFVTRLTTVTELARRLHKVGTHSMTLAIEFH